MTDETMGVWNYKIRNVYGHDVEVTKFKGEILLWVAGTCETYSYEAAEHLLERKKQEEMKKWREQTMYQIAEAYKVPEALIDPGKYRGYHVPVINDPRDARKIWGI